MSCARALAVIALLSASLGCREEAITMTSTAVRGPAGSVIATIEPYTPLVVRAQPFGDKGWLKVVEGAPVGEVRASHVAVLPISPLVDRYVVPDRVEVTGPGAARTLPACAHLSGVVYEGEEGSSFIFVEGGKPSGSVPLSKTATTPPSAEAFIKATEAALRELQSDYAERQAEAALSCANGNRAMRAILAELAGRTSEARRAELLRNEAPWPALPVVATGAPVAEGDVAFIADVDVALRAGTNEKDPTVSDLAIGTSVRVLAIAPPWAQVQSLAGDVVVDLNSPFELQEPLTDAIYGSALRAHIREGYVPLTALARGALDVGAIVAEAKARGATSEAVVLWRRAAALLPADLAVRRSLVDAALRAGRPVEAVRGAQVPIGGTSRIEINARVDVLFGCIGDVKKATVSPGQLLSLDGDLGDRCVTFDPRPPCLNHDCPNTYDIPCGEGEHEDDHDHDHNDSEEVDTRSEAVIAAEEEAARAREQAEEAARIAGEAQAEADAAERHVKLVAEGEEILDRAKALAAALPRGPLIRVTLKNLERLPADVDLFLVQGKKSTLTSEPNVSACAGKAAAESAACEAAARAAWERAGGCGIDVYDIAASVRLPLPKPLPQGELVVFADAPAGLSYLVVQVPRGMAVGEAIVDAKRVLDFYAQPTHEPDCSCPVHCD